MNRSTIALLAVIFLVVTNVLFVTGQHPGKSPRDYKLLHHETQDDPYLPNTYNNSRVSPAYKYRTPATPQITSASVFTTQVNVDASGQNILGDAANEPSIARNPLNPDEMVIGWRQFDNVFSNFRQAGWAFTGDGGQTWTFPGNIEPGIFRSDPVLDFDATGNFYYNSLTNSPTYLCKVFRSADGGATWDTGTDAFGGDKQWMAIDRTTGTPSFNIYSFWSSAYTSCTPGFFTRSVDSGNTYNPCDSIPGDPALGTMVVNEAGELFIAGVSNLTDSLVVVKSITALNAGTPVTWQPYAGVFMDGSLNGWTSVNPSGLFGQVNIDVDRSNGAGQGNVYILASVMRYSSFDPSDVMFSRSTDGGLTWSPPVRVNDDVSTDNTQWFGTMSVAPDGRIDAVWLDTREDIALLDSSALYYSYSTNQGATWSANEKISALFDPHVGYPNQMKMGDYFDMESDSTGAHLAWANTFNGEQDVYYSYIQPQIFSGINHVTAPPAYTIYPNPSTGVFNLSGSVQPADVEVFSVQGQRLFFTTTNKQLSTIDISSMPAGIYFLKITGADGNVVMKKVILE